MTDRQQLEQAIATLEAQRATLGDAVVDASIAALQKQLAELEPTPPTEQQRKQVTILFADVSGFTAMSETMDAEDVSEIMNALWQDLDVVITDHGGLIDKHIGDAVMALWGAEVAREDDPEQAIRAALAMREALATFREGHQLKLAMRIGLNTGPVLLGEVGSTAEFTAMGDTVNTASRLEHAAPVGGILIAHDTYQHVRGIFNVQAQDPLQVKGKVEPLQVYVVEGAKPRAFRIGRRGVEGIETRMIGREAELKQLQDAYHRVAEDSEGQLVTVIGEAGVGKSRLLYEFKNWLELLPETVRYFQGRARLETGNQPYGLLRDLFAFRFEIADSDQVETVRQKIETGFGEVFGTEQEDQMRSHFIGQLLGYDFKTSPHLAKVLEDAKQIHDRALIYLAEFFHDTAALEPTVILLEDIHWADGSSLDMLTQLARMMREMSLLIVALARPTLFERHPHWGEGQIHHTRLDLRPLSTRDSYFLLEEILRKIPDIPAELRELVIRKAEGNPFYIEELIKMLIEDGVIVMDEATWAVKTDRLSGIRVPSTLIGILQARLDSLPPEERTTLQQASVVGRIFWDSTLDYLIAKEVKSQSAALKTDQKLKALQKREMIFQRASSAFTRSVEYIFKHALLRDVTRESVLKRVRRKYHKLVAEWLIEHSGERIAEYAGLIGEHYQQSGETSQAVDWFVKAAQQAKAAYANESALQWYELTLEMLDQLDSAAASPFESLRLSVLQSMGEVFYLVGRYDEALDHYASARALLEASTLSPDEAHHLAGLCRLTAWVHESKGEYDTGIQWIKKGLSYLDDQETTLELALLYQVGAWLHERKDWFDEAIAWDQKGIAIASQLNTRAGKLALARIYHHLGIVFQRHGDYDQAKRYLQESLGICQQYDHIAGQLRVYIHLGIIYEKLGDWDQASDVYARGLAIVRKIGHIYNEAALLNNAGILDLQRGEWDQAMFHFEQSLTIWNQLGVQFEEANILSNIAYIQIYRENWSEARQALERSQAIFTKIGSDEMMPEVERHWAELYLETGELDQALSHINRSIQLAVALRSPLEEGMSRRVLGQVYRAQGERDLAEAQLRHSLQILSDIDGKYHLAKTRLALALLLMESGQPAEAQKYLHPATETFGKLGAKADLAEARKLAQRYGNEDESPP